MGLFDAFKKKGMEIRSPLKGKCVSIKEVSDPTFSEEILGKGVAVIPEDGKVCAPADGVITTMFPTGHAVGRTILARGPRSQTQRGHRQPTRLQSRSYAGHSA